MTADFSSETRQAKRQWKDIFKVLKVKTSLNLEFYVKRKYLSKMNMK